MPFSLLALKLWMEFVDISFDGALTGHHLYPDHQRSIEANVLLWEEGEPIVTSRDHKCRNSWCLTKSHNSTLSSWVQQLGSYCSIQGFISLGSQLSDRLCTVIVRTCLSLLLCNSALSYEKKRKKKKKVHFF